MEASLLRVAAAPSRLPSRATEAAMSSSSSCTGELIGLGTSCSLHRSASLISSTPSFVSLSSHRLSLSRHCFTSSLSHTSYLSTYTCSVPMNLPTQERYIGLPASFYLFVFLPFSLIGFFLVVKQLLYIMVFHCLLKSFSVYSRFLSWSLWFLVTLLFLSAHGLL
jgi:hypothetical protein